jgi:exopolyphosphatase / guanosine-5'-triphosphate,3'-diphosphate pyrophosphatase
MVRNIGQTEDSPVCTGAGDAIWSRLKELSQSVKKIEAVHERDSTPEEIEAAVHKVRVSARRAGVALTVFKSWAEDDAWGRARKLVRRVRRAAGVLRDADVHTGLLAALRGHEHAASKTVVQWVLDRIAKDRAEGQQRLWRILEDYPRRLRRAGKHLVGSLKERTLGMEETGAAEVSRLASEVRTLSDTRIEEPVHLHELRLAIKRLRYTLEVFAPCMSEELMTPIMPVLEEGQKQAGEANDVLVLVQRLAAYVGELEQSPGVDESLRVALVGLRDRYAGVGDRRCERFAAWWRDQDVRNLLAPIVGRSAPTEDDLVEQDGKPSTEAPVMRETGKKEAEHANGEAPEAIGRTNGTPAPAASQRNLWLSGQRLAVIDIGSNSIRLLAVELIDERGWRTLGEERAMTRLAHGMDKGLLCAEAMARSVEAIGRFKAIAEKLGATNVRAFATAAVREAENKNDFISLIADRTGLQLEVVSALDEGKLTHRSVSRVFDLSHGSAAVIDIGGGSVEVVFSCRGVITENSSMPLGAVRVTEAFGGADRAAGEGYKDMRRWIDRQIGRHVREHDNPPAVLVGCGGAFTTLLTLAAASRGVLIDRSSSALSSLGPVGRTQLKGLIADLRGMTLEQRLRVPGLPSDRADIIIAGLTAIERTMKYLGASQVHVHPGGFREGLVLRMIEEEIALRARGGVEPTERDLVDSARRLAVRCGYERAHSEHVARLALSLFDQFRDESDLLAGLGGTKAERALLEAAALLHDVGTIVEYPRHHKHSQTIIRHADLNGWPPRQVELLATIARYHRRALPSMEHEEFGALSEAERAVVKRLAAILRVADGLDRSHSQAVQGVRVRFGNGAVSFAIRAEAEPTTDLKSAAEKSDLLAAMAGVSVDFGLDASTEKPARASGAVVPTTERPLSRADA